MAGILGAYIKQGLWEEVSPTCTFYHSSRVLPLSASQTGSAAEPLGSGVESSTPKSEFRTINSVAGPVLERHRELSSPLPPSSVHILLERS